MGNKFQGVGNGRNGEDGDLYAFAFGRFFLHYQKESFRVGIKINCELEITNCKNF